MIQQVTVCAWNVHQELWHNHEDEYATVRLRYRWCADQKQWRHLTSVLQSKVRTPVAGGTRIKLMFTAPNFLKHFVDFWEKTLWNDNAIQLSVRGPFLDRGVHAVCVKCIVLLKTQIYLFCSYIYCMWTEKQSKMFFWYTVYKTWPIMIKLGAYRPE